MTCRWDQRRIMKGNTMSKTYEAFDPKSKLWTIIPRDQKCKIKGKSVTLYDACSMLGLPIRVVWPNGSTYIIENEDKARELGLIAGRKTKAAKPKAKAKSKTKPKSKSPKTETVYEAINPVLTMEGENVVAINGKSCFL